MEYHRDWVIYRPTLDLWLPFAGRLSARLRSDLGVKLNSTDQLITDGDMEAADLVWTTGGGAVLSKESGTRPGGSGAQVLRITDPVDSAYAIQELGGLPLKSINGKMAHFRGWAKGDGNCAPAVGDGFGSSNVWVGTSSTDWQYFNVHHVLTGSYALLAKHTLLPGYVEFDDVVVTRSYAEDVVSWNGQLGLARNVIQETPLSQPSYSPDGGPNNHPYIEFDGVDDYLQGSWTDNQPSTTFLVAMPSVSDATSASLIDGANNTSGLIYVTAADQISIFAGAQLQYSPPGTIESTDWHYIRMTLDGSNSAIHVDGVKSATSPGNAGTNDPGGLTIGARGGGSFFGDLRIAEFIRYSGVLSDTEAAQVEMGYLVPWYAL
jgi:hypothetical protein